MGRACQWTATHVKAVLLIALAQAPVPPAFHPIENAVYRCDTNETRTDDGLAQHFHASRRIVFRHEAGGYLAEVTIDQADQTGPQLGSAFLAGNRAFLNRTVVVHLDPAGTVTAVNDADALIERMAASIEAAARKVTSPARAAAMAAPLRGFDAGQRRAMLGSAIGDLIRPADLARADGTRTVTLPSRPPLLPGQGLPATETVHRGANDITIATHGAGPIAVGGAMVPGTASGAMTIDTSRRIDAASALTIEERSTRTITTASGAHSSRAETITTLRLEPETS